MAAEGEKKGAMEAEKGEKGATVEKAAAEAKEVSGGKVITLRSSDGVERRLSVAVAQLWGLIKGMIEEGCADICIPLPNVAAGTLNTVIQCCNKHLEAATKPDSNPTAAAAGSSSGSVNTVASKDWDRKLLDSLTLDALFDLLLAVNCLVIEGLLDATCQKIADMIKGKTPQLIREIFNIANDFTPEEEAELRQQYAWVFDE